ncbi:hypothetical protein JD844_005711, partial [Phrynosoma platyrhinos]
VRSEHHIKLLLYHSPIPLKYIITTFSSPPLIHADRLNAVRAFMLIGMIAGAVSFFGLCVTFCKSQLGSISLAMISAIASFAAGICAMIAMAIFTADTSSYGWSFGLGWASFPLFLITSKYVQSGNDEMHSFIQTYGLQWDCDRILRAHL